MNKIILLFILLTFGLAAKSQEILDLDSILWNKDIKLKWEDFKGEPPKKENRGLHTVAGACVGISLSIKFPEEDTLVFLIVSVFYKNCSWTTTQNLNTLDHEQLHFDITELYARKIRKRFKELQDMGETDYEEYVKIYYELEKELDAFQQKYDSEVYFREQNQKEWIEKIAKELEELKEYECIPADSEEENDDE